ncbi:MAG: arginase family protein [Actinobacteria bacterium]|nr:arginase family protein [Actinomycetota bacterium]
MSGPPLFPLVGVPTFLRAPYQPDLDQLDATIAVVGVPSDEGSPFLPGTRLAPRSLREHSMRLCAGGAGYYDAGLRRTFLEREMRAGRIVDVGDAAILPTNAPASFDNVTAKVRGILERGALPVALGGDHATTWPVVRAFAGEPMHVVQFDAHLDFEPFEHGLECTNGHGFRHIAASPDVAGLTQVGIRGIRNGRRQLDEALEAGNRVVLIDEFREGGLAEALAAIPAGERCYVSIDIDVLDLSLVPGCVSAEPDGMSYPELRDALGSVARHLRVVGFDLCEVNPMLDVGTGVTSYLGAHTIVEFLGRICAEAEN